MRYLHIFGTYRYQYRGHFWDISIPIPCHIYNKKEKEIGKERKQKNGINTIMHSGSRSSRERRRLVFAGGTVCPMMCPSDGQQKDDKKGQAGDKARIGQRQGAKAKRRPSQGGQFSLKPFFPGVLW